jgi:hypothetical protein
LRNESGATAIEYGLIASVIAVFIVAALNQPGTTERRIHRNRQRPKVICHRQGEPVRRNSVIDDPRRQEERGYCAIARRR